MRRETFSPLGQLFLAAGALALLAGLASLANLGWLARFQADDYCTYGRYVSLGLGGSQAYWYLHWSGRFSATFVNTLLHAISLRSPMVLAAFTLIGWTLAGTWAAARWLGQPPAGRNPLAALVLGACLPLASLSLAPNLYQVLYWQTGHLTYLLPLVGMTALVGWLAGRPHQAEWGPVDLALTFGAALLLAGFSETFGFVQTIGWGLMATYSLAVNRGSGTWKLALAGAVGSGLGLLIVALAPGNDVRQGLMQPPSPIPQVLARSVRDAYVLGASLVKYQALTLALAVAAAFGVSVSLRPEPTKTTSAGRRAWLGIFLWPVASFLLVAAVMFPSEYALSSYPDGRVLVTAAFVVISAVIVWAAGLAQIVTAIDRVQVHRRYWLPLVLLVVAVLAAWVSVGQIGRGLQLRPDMQDFATGWENRHQAIRQAVANGAERLAVASLPHLSGLAEVEIDPDTWINRCIAEAYGLRSVVPK